MMETPGIGQPPPPAPAAPLQQKLDYIIATIKELAMAPKEQKQIVFKHTVAPLQGIIDHKHIPMLKTVKTVTIHWPSGCSSLVKVAVGYSQDKRLLPEEGYLALDNATPTWTVNKDVGTDTLWVEIRNGSSLNAYPISVIINYEELGG